MNPLIGGKVLTVHPEANQLHEAGLRAELRGNYAEAHASLGAASQILADMPATVDTVVQSARITRDDGFTDVRVAIAENDPELLHQARRSLMRSVETTAPLVGGTQFLGTEQAQGTPKRARREVFAEHGATLSLLGRVATVEQVMIGADTRSGGDAATVARTIGQQPYGLAHDLLRIGNNGYYRVSNAMVAARQERLNGRSLHAARWLGRAAAGLAWTAARDRGNFKAAARTAAGRLRHLRSYATAAASVQAKP